MTSNENIKRIGIIGEGIMGLSIGNILQDRYPLAHLQITTNETYKSSTSYVSAGFVFFKMDENIDERWFKWYKKSLDHYWKVYRSADSVLAGITLNNFFYLSENPITMIPEYCQLYQGFRSVEQEELRSFGFSSKFKYAVSLTSTLVEPQYYLNYLENKFIKNGGEIIINKLSGGSDYIADWALHKKYDIVVNCSGLGSKDLFQDQEIQAIRGQIVKVEAPWFKHSFMTSDYTYAFSCPESVKLGTTHQRNDSDLSIRSEDTNDILRRIRKHNICLSESKIIETNVGLRPWKSKIRLEIELAEASNGTKIPIVHNYGHGSSGIGLSWGTSLEVADLVDSFVRENLNK